MVTCPPLERPEIWLLQIQSNSFLNFSWVISFFKYLLLLDIQFCLVQSAKFKGLQPQGYVICVLQTELRESQALFTFGNKKVAIIRFILHLLWSHFCIFKNNMYMSVIIRAELKDSVDLSWSFIFIAIGSVSHT